MIRTKQFLFITLSIFLFISCNSGSKSHNKISDQLKSKSINDLKLNSQTDTTSYALGVVWANGLEKLGLNGIGCSFYLGAADYLMNDSSIFSFEKADNYLNTRVAAFKTDPSWAHIDASTKLGSIEISTKYDTVSYALGVAWTRAVKTIGIDSISPQILLGLDRAMNHDTSLFTYKSADKYLRAHVEVLRETKFQDIKLKNTQWLEENKKTPGVVSLPSGLQYKIIKKGKGTKQPKLTDVITCNYTGKLIDNTVFDSSNKNPEPFKFYLTGVIQGWTEAIQMMHEGDVWELYVPYNLGYGSGGVKDKVSPYSTLIFEVEIVSIEKPK